jgi:2-aminoethylphosphonate--pyruvate transaminase/phosphonoacetaldehyde hydrolase
MNRSGLAAPSYPAGAERLKAVVLDWAGTTVDFGSVAPARTMQRLFASQGIELSEQETRQHMGLPKKEHIRGILSLARVREAWTQKHGAAPIDADVNRMYEAFIPMQFSCLMDYSAVIPGAAEAVAALRVRGLKIGSTTGYTREMLDMLLDSAAREGYAPDCSLTPGEVGEGRPHPFMMFECARRLGVYPMPAIAKVGDTPVDIEEGLNAGSWSIGVAGTGNAIGLTQAEYDSLSQTEKDARLVRARRQLREAGAHYVIDNLAQLGPVLDAIDARLLAASRNASPDKLLFTPGPLTTSTTVKSAMQHDAGSRDREFIATVRSIRSRLLAIGGASAGESGYECVLMQGSGTFAIEAVASSAIPSDGKLLVLVNGAYGRRIAQMARIHGIATETLDAAEDETISPAAVAERLAASPGITHVAAVHCETTTGLLNPIEEIGAAVHKAGAVYIVDAMSSFGAIPIDLAAARIDFLISSANKCIEGVPGFGFVLARHSCLVKAKGNARTLSLDLHAQWAGLEADGQFRFTPPTHALLAFRQALDELEAEGGVPGRMARYRRNHQTLMRGAEELGLETYLRPEDQGPIITTFRYPSSPDFDFTRFYEALSERGFIIYPGKLTAEPCFRIGTIGRLQPEDISALLEAMREVLEAMKAVSEQIA